MLFRSAGTSNGLKTFAAQAQAFLIKTLLAIIELFRPVVDAFKEVGRAFGDLFGLFSKFNKEAGATQTAIDLLLIPIKNLANGLKLFAQFLVSVVDGFRSLVEQSPFIQKFISILVQGFRETQKIVSELPFTFAGVIAALKQLGTNFKNFFESLFIDTQILAARVKGVDRKSVV